MLTTLYLIIYHNTQLEVEKRQALCTKVESKLLPYKGNEISVKTVGFIVNPIAGMGGAVGLKGTDGKATLERATVLGAKPIASARAASFLSELEPVKKRIQLAVGAGRMGQDQARSHGFTHTVLGERKKETTAEDTKEIASRITDTGAALLIFCGGDGTARDILNAVNTHLPVLGVPTGVKMHSAVFAVEPKAAAKIAMGFLWGELPKRSGGNGCG